MACKMVLNLTMKHGLPVKAEWGGVQILCGGQEMISQKKDIVQEKVTAPVSAPLAVRRQEAARMLGLSITTVDRAIKRGDLRVKRYGTRRDGANH